MKKKERSEYRTKKIVELEREIEELRRKKADLLLGKSMGKMSVKELRAAKKAIAVLMTIKTELAESEEGAYNRERKKL